MTKVKWIWPLSAIAILCLAQSLWACWQTSRPPIKMSNDRISVKFTYEGKPLAGAVAFLSNQKRTVSLHITVDKDGWVRFPKIPSGRYKLVMDGPSHESFDVELTHSDANARGILVAFSEDYCAYVSLGRDPMFYDF